jgi:predicted metal-dependent phosphoesterase TrpH
VIDLHLHTTSSDGRSTPAELVDLAAAAGLTVMAVTDHDTTAAIADVQSMASRHGIEAIAGIEITAGLGSRDVHVLGYFFDPRNRPFLAFLVAQRERRVARIEAIVARLAELGMRVEMSAQLAMARRLSGQSLARPHVARAMVAAGYTKDVRTAFDAWLAEGRPAYVERSGPSPSDVVAAVHDAGGLVSLAHPGRTRIDEQIPGLVEAGLDALEVFHSDHDAESTARYREMAARHGVLTTGGTDFHAEPARGLSVGQFTLPADEWARLSAARHRFRAS